MKKILIMWAAMLPFFVFSGCSEDEKEELRLISVELSDKDVVLDVGDTFQFEVIATPSDFPVDKYEWTVVSKDGKGDGRIDRNGLFTATKAGVVYVEVLTPNILNGNIPFYDNTTVEIRGEDDADGEEEPEEETPAISGISFSPSSLSLKKGESSYIDYSVQPANADASGIRWNVSDNSIISITSVSNGRISVNALKAGEAEVYTTVNGKRYACQIKVEAVKVERITLNPSEITLNQGESFTLDVSIYPYNADNSELNFEFSDESVAYLGNEEQRVISTSNPGKCTVTVSTKDGSVKAECVITVLEIPLEEKITASTRLNGLYNNGFITGTVYIEFYNGSDKDVTINRFYVYDSFLNQVVYEEKNCGTLMGGHDWDTALMFKMVYEPLYVWEYECEGESYTLEYREEF